jgi:hypothetical protein
MRNQETGIFIHTGSWHVINSYVDSFSLSLFMWHEGGGGGAHEGIKNQTL